MYNSDTVDYVIVASEMLDLVIDEFILSKYEIYMKEKEEEKRTLLNCAIILSFCFPCFFCFKPNICYQTLNKFSPGTYLQSDVNWFHVFLSSLLLIFFFLT